MSVCADMCMCEYAENVCAVSVCVCLYVNAHVFVYMYMCVLWNPKKSHTIDKDMKSTRYQDKYFNIGC